jgi:arsenite-transporting ATPase
MAIAMAERAPAKRLLLLSTDPAHSLGDALGAELDDRATTVTGAPANLHVRELDATTAFEEEKRKYRASIDELFDSIFRGKMDASFDRQVLEDLLDLAPPGLDELFAILSIVDALLPDGRVHGSAKNAKEHRAYDVVVVDTAPTGHTLRLLELPASALEWVHAIMSVILKYRRVIGLGDLASDLTALAKRLRALIALLADRERTAFVAVTRAAALPRLETERLVAALKRLHVPLASVLVNAVTEPSCSRCSEAAALEAPEIARLDALAKRARASTVHARAVHPPPRGPAELRAWCASWASRAMLGPRRR